MPDAGSPSPGPAHFDGPAGRLLAIALAAMVLGLLAISALRMSRAWPNEAHLGYAEGIWTAIAIDSAHGVFYRPLEGPLGYGGTRYFPLFFTLHGALIRTGLSPISAGYLLATASVILLLTAVSALIRALGGSWVLAIVAAGLALACQPVQMALLSIRGDALPAGLALLGLACCADDRRRRWAPLCFGLAFAAKPTSLYAPAAGVLALAAAGHVREAIRVGILTAAGLVTVLVVMHVASHGRVLPILAASALGGGTVASLVSAPLSLGRILRRVPESAFFIQLAAAGLLATLRRSLAIERAAFLACLAATLVIYASPATVENHLIDLSAISVVVLIGTAIRVPAMTRWILAVALIGGVSAATTAMWRLQTVDALDLRTPRQDALAAVADVGGPILAEQPMLMAERREPSYLLDPYLFSLRVGREPARLNQLVDDLHRHLFGAVILEHASLDLAVQDTFPGSAGERFLAALHDTYVLDRVVDGRPIFRPR